MTSTVTSAPSHAGSAPSGTRRLTLLCLGALGLGILAGVLAGGAGFPGTAGAAGVAEVLVRAWTNAFRLLVVPLVTSQLYLALAGSRPAGRSAGRLGLVMAGVFAGLLLGTALVSTGLALGLVRLPFFAGISLRPLAAAPAPAAGGAGGAAWVDGIIPANLVAAATTDNLLPLMLFAVVFALAMRRADAAAADTIAAFARGVSHACFTLVGWLLRLVPVVVLALGYRAALDAGLEVGVAVLGVAVLEIVAVLLVLGLLYPVTAVLGGISIARFARAVWPAQLTGMTTRSSLAALPALYRAAESELALAPDTAACVLPLAGATLKVSRAVTGPVRLVFLAHVLGIPLGVEQLVVFTITIILLSASVPGVPSVTSGNRSLPAYVAAGIPAGYVVLLGVAVNLTDVFLTLINTTGYLSAAAITDRWRGHRPFSAASPPPGTGTGSTVAGGIRDGRYLEPVSAGQAEAP